MSTGHEDRDTDGPFDMSDRDHVTLSAHERQSLAHLEARLRNDDPDFATRMRGRSWRWMRHVASTVRLPAMPAWLGPVLVGVGLLTTLWAVEAVAWLSVVSVGITVLGAHRVGSSVRGRVEHRRGTDRPSGLSE